MTEFISHRNETILWKSSQWQKVQFCNTNLLFLMYFYSIIGKNCCFVCFVCFLVGAGSGKEYNIVSKHPNSHTSHFFRQCYFFLLTERPCTDLKLIPLIKAIKYFKVNIFCHKRKPLFVTKFEWFLCSISWNFRLVEHKYLNSKLSGLNFVKKCSSLVRFFLSLKAEMQEFLLQNI